LKAKGAILLLAREIVCDPLKFKSSENAEEKETGGRERNEDALVALEGA